MPRGGRRITGRAAVAMAIRKERTKDHLLQMLEVTKSRNADGQLSSLLEVHGRLAKSVSVHFCQRCRNSYVAFVPLSTRCILP